MQSFLEKSKQKNPFVNNRPGRKWMNLFLKRHPEISVRHTEILSKARASVTEEDIRKWFVDLKQYLTEEGAHDILENPSRIFNMDETGMSLCPKIGKILGEKGEKNQYILASGQEKQCMSVLCTVSADGESVDPLIIYPYKRFPRDIIESIPDGVAAGKSDSGWMISPTFFEYIANVFYPKLVEKNISFPVLVLFDGHKSHINLELHDFCNEKKILLFCLLPNATHILQPCDVGIFRPLKTEWKRVVQKHMQASRKPITKVNFASIFHKAYLSALKPQTIKNSFETCGLYPFNPNKVDYSKCMSTRHKQVQHISKDIEANVNKISINEVLIDLERNIPTEVITAFEHALKYV